jgi:hypothetical protein
MQRNDADIAAVIDLNRSLLDVKNAFIETYNNEVLLLQVGQGVYRLSPDGSDQLVKPVLVTSTGTTAIPSPPKTPSPSKGNNSATPSTPPPQSGVAAAPNVEIVSTTSTVIQYESISNDEIASEQQELCVDFLLRKKLRRKLISRILRRLQRVATSMDHLEQMTIPSLNATSMASFTITDVVAPPGPPKYGDLRLYCDPLAVQEFAVTQQKKINALRQMTFAREGEASASIKHPKGTNIKTIAGATSSSLSTPTSSPKRNPTKTSDNVPAHSDATANATYDQLNADSTDKDSLSLLQLHHPETVQNDGIQKVVEHVKSHPETEPQQDHQSNVPLLTEVSSQEIVMDDLVADQTVSCSSTTCIDTGMTSTLTSAETEFVQELPSATVSKPEVTDSEVIPASTDETITLLTSTVTEPSCVDFEIFKDYKDAYEKMINSVVPADAGLARDNTVSFLQTFPNDKMDIKYTILQNPREEDYLIVKNGIGATHPNMTTQEREVEYQKWQSTLLSRIPEQPTYAELGYENRVFFFEERMQRALRNQQKRNLERSDQQAPSGTTHSTDMDVEEQEENKVMEEIESQAGGDENVKMSTRTSRSGVSKVTDDVEMEEEAADADVEVENENKEIEKVVESIPLRPISLVAIPSYYEQDLKRIKLVQSELMSHSMRYEGLRRLESVTREFNQCT